MLTYILLIIHSTKWKSR